MVWALVIIITLMLSPTLALAEDGVMTETHPVAEVDTSEVEGLNRLNQTVETQLQQINDKLDAEARERETEKQLEEIESVSNPQEQQLQVLTNIDNTLTEISGRDESVQLMAQEPLLAASSHAFVAYANVSPTGTYAQYAIGMLPRVAWKEHYVFLQDTSSSYVFMWGDLTEADDNTISGSGRYVRWYYSGNQYGYLTEDGEGSISATLNSHVVLSDLGTHPILGDELPLLRREVALYAVAAVVIFSLASVWTFTVRLRGSVSVS